MSVKNILLVHGAWADGSCWSKVIPLLEAQGIVASNDRTIPPELEKTMATKLNADTVTIEASHVVMLSHPDKVVEVIVRAATSA